MNRHPACISVPYLFLSFYLAGIISRWSTLLTTILDGANNVLTEKAIVTQYLNAEPEGGATVGMRCRLTCTSAGSQKSRLQQDQSQTFMTGVHGARHDADTSKWTDWYHRSQQMYIWTKNIEGRFALMLDDLRFLRISANKEST